MTIEQKAQPWRIDEPLSDLERGVLSQKYTAEFPQQSIPPITQLCFLWIADSTTSLKS